MDNQQHPPVIPSAVPQALPSPAPVQQVSSPLAVPNTSGAPNATEIDPLSAAEAAASMAALQHAQNPHAYVEAIAKIRVDYVRQKYGVELP